MQIVIQRVKEASVKVEDQQVSSIGAGMVLLVCMEVGDESLDLSKVVSKLLKLRIFADDAGKMNLNITQVGAEILAISQFTLSWQGGGGNRPSFEQSMPVSQAADKFDKFIRLLKEHIPTYTGVFGADMQVSLVNDGPVTFSLSY